MKTLIIILGTVFFIATCSCGKDSGGGPLDIIPPDTTQVNPNPTPDPEPEPEPKPEPPVIGPTIVTIGTIPEKVMVEKETEIPFTIVKENYKGKFKVKIEDGTIPEFEVITMGEVDGGQGHREIRKGYTLEIDNKAVGDSINVGQHAFKIKNPAVVGDYRINVTFTDQEGKNTTEVLKFTVTSPDVIVKIYEVDPWLDLKIYDKNYYEILNRDYTYDPLSPVFVGKQVDTIYSQEVPKPGYPGKWTFPGRGMTVYIGQTGEKDFYCSSGIERTGNTKTLSPTWDNTSAALRLHKQGFHCFEFVTTPDDSEEPGTSTFKITFYDYWGKPVECKLAIVLLDRNATMPETGHRLPD